MEKRFRWAVGLLLAAFVIAGWSAVTISPGGSGGGSGSGTGNAIKDKNGKGTNTTLDSLTLINSGNFGDGSGGSFNVQSNAILQIMPLGQLLINGDDPVASHRAEIFLHGTNSHIRLDAGADLEDATAVTHLTMAPGSASLDATFNVNGPGTGANVTMISTNLFGVYIKVAPTNNDNITNIMGIIRYAFGSVITFDASQTSRLTVTNRVTSAATLVITNTIGRLELDAFILGEASGGTDRIITIVPDLGHLIFNEDTYGTALATSYAFTLTNGNAVEIQDARRMLNGTNIHAIVTRQGKF